MPLLTFGPAHLVHPAQEIIDYVEHLIARLSEEGLYYRGPDRRSETRHRVALGVKAVPLDWNLMSSGPEFTATTRDISNGGIAIVHSAVVDEACHFLAVELIDNDGRFLQAAVEILRCGPIGPYAEIAGRFVTKVRRYDPFISAN